MINLKLSFDGQTLDLTLKSGEEIIIGRGKNCSVVIPKTSISSEHLKIFWSGTELEIKDLASSNGTFRMPQEAPFSGATFSGLVASEINLRLSKTPLKIAWTTEQAAAHTHTEALSQSGDQVTNEQPIPAKMIPAGSTAAKKIESTPPKNKNISLTQQPLMTGAQALVIAKATRLTLVGAVLLFTSLLWGFLALRGLLFSSPSAFARGGAHDLILVWYGILTKDVFLSLISIFLYFGFYIWYGQKFLGSNKSIIRNAQKIQTENRFSLNVFRFLHLPLWLLALLWIPLGTLLISLLVGSFKVNPMNVAYFKFWHTVRASQASLDQRSENLKELLIPLRGSSLLYKELFLTQRSRVLRECQGQGTDAAWEQKRICLILLAAVGIETLGEVRPAFLAETSSRAAMLLSLDGVSRTLLVEGRSAPTLEFFLSALDDVGLGPEAEDIRKILNEPSLQDAAAAEMIRDLRVRLENELMNQQKLSHLPRLFLIQVPGPLELGI